MTHKEITAPYQSNLYVRPRILATELNSLLDCLESYIDNPTANLKQSQRFALWELKQKLERTLASAGTGSGNKVMTAAQVDFLLEDSETGAREEKEDSESPVSEDEIKSLEIETLLAKALATPKEITRDDSERYFELTGTYL